VNSEPRDESKAVAILPRTQCQHAETLMSRKIDREITPEDERTLDEHLIVCPACRKQYQAWVSHSKSAREGLKALWPAK